MSYILDALRKTEAENDPVAAANLALNEQRQQSRSRLLITLVTIALLANAAVLGWIFKPGLQTRESIDLRPALAPQTSSPGVSSVNPAKLRPGPTPTVAPAAVPTVTQMAPGPTTMPSASPSRAPGPSVQRPKATTRVRLAELPAAARDRFPGLAFSTHIYADDPSLRAIVANGNRLTEGDQIGSARVQQITEDGVLMTFENYLVEISVIAEWD